MSVNKFYRIEYSLNARGINPGRKRAQSSLHALDRKACSHMVTLSTQDLQSLSERHD